MAHLNKQQYEYRDRSARNRMKENTQIAVQNGMTEEQAELIVELCSLRHELHTNMDAVTVSDENLRIKDRLVRNNLSIRESGLVPMNFIPSDYIDIDDLSERQILDAENGEPWAESGTPEWQDKWDKEYFRIYDELESLNSQIESYLKGIDKIFGTRFCPTGDLRIF